MHDLFQGHSISSFSRSHYQDVFEMVYARAPVDLLDGLPTTSLPVFSTDGPAAASPKREPSPPPLSKTLGGTNQVPSESDDDQSEEEREKRLKDLQDQVTGFLLCTGTSLHSGNVT